MRREDKMRVARSFGRHAMAGLMLLAGASAAAAQTPMTLKVADSYPPGHFIPTQGTIPWMEQITQLTNGQVKFEHYPAEQLGKINDLPTLLRTGVTQVALVAVGLMPGDYPLASIAALPGAAQTATQVSRAYWSLLGEDGPLRKEFQSKGLKPLAYFGLPQYEIFTSKKQVATIDDLRGLKIRAGGGLQARIIRALGAAPVQLPTPEIYSGIDRGTIDGVMIPYPSARSYRLEEVARFATAGSALGSTVVGYAITERLWRQLSPEVQAAFDKASAAFIERIAAYQDQSNQQDQAYLAGKNVRFSAIEGADAARWKAAIEPVAAEWVADMQAKNLPGKEVYESWLRAVAAVAQKPVATQ